MEALVELGAVSIDHLTGKPIFDRSYDAIARRGSKSKQSDQQSRRRSNADDARDLPSATNIPTTPAPSTAGSRRRHRNTLPSPERDADDARSFAPSAAPPYTQFDRAETESEISDRITRKRYERERYDPVCTPETLRARREGDHHRRRDSAMTSRYDDGYSQAPYRSRSSQPARSRYYDDDDSDYDERTGRRYTRGSGRGYDDRDDRDDYIVREETERYRGPVSAGPLVVSRPNFDQSRQESFRSNYDEAALARRGDGVDDRRTMVSRRSKSRGREYSRSRSRSRSYSRSRSGSRGGIKEKLGEHFDTSKRGLGVGLAGAVIGGLAGRQFGHKHKERDIILGAIVGGVGANLAENKYHQWKEEKEGKLERDEQRYEQRWDGRSRSNVR